MLTQTLIFDYYFRSEEELLLLLSYFSANQLITSISAINVQQEINFSFPEELMLYSLHAYGTSSIE